MRKTTLTVALQLTFEHCIPTTAVWCVTAKIICLVRGPESQTANSTSADAFIHLETIAGPRKGYITGTGNVFPCPRQESIIEAEINPYPTAFPYGNGMVLHFYQQQESSTTKTVHKVINKGLKTYV